MEEEDVEEEEQLVAVQGELTLYLLHLLFILKATSGLLVPGGQGATQRRQIR